MSGFKRHADEASEAAAGKRTRATDGSAHNARLLHPLSLAQAHYLTVSRHMTKVSGLRALVACTCTS
eukprot:2186460-Pleurochrysis_carterae.AAC.3